MAKNEGIVCEGKVLEVLPGSQFRVLLSNGHEIMAYVSGKMRMFSIRIEEGDNVSIEISPYDLTRGRIIYRK